MSKIFTTELSKTTQNKNIVVNEFSYLNTCNKTTISCPEISYQYKNSSFGEALILSNEMGLCGLAFCDQFGKDAALADMMLRWPKANFKKAVIYSCLLYTSPSPRDRSLSRMPSSA